MRLVVVPAGFSSLPLMDCQLGGSKQNRYLSIKLGSRGAKNRAPEADFVAAQQSQRFSVSNSVCGHRRRAASRTLRPRDPPGLDELSPGLELPQVPTGSQVLLESGESSYFGRKSCIFSGSIGCQGMEISECFTTMQLKGKLFLSAQAQGYRYRVFLQGMFWTEILSEYRLPEPSSAQALDFFESAEFFCPVQL